MLWLLRCLWKWLPKIPGTVSFCTEVLFLQRTDFIWVFMEITMQNHKFSSGIFFPKHVSFRFSYLTKYSFEKNLENKERIAASIHILILSIFGGWADVVSKIVVYVSTQFGFLNLPFHNVSIDTNQCKNTYIYILNKMLNLWNELELLSSHNLYFQHARVITHNNFYLQLHSSSWLSSIY